MSDLTLVGADWSIFEGNKAIYMPDINISVYLEWAR